MQLITQPRDIDVLAEFGIMQRFAALVHTDPVSIWGSDYVQNFEPYNLDGLVVFPDPDTPIDELNRAFDAWVVALQNSQDQFLESGDEEGFIALLTTPKGPMFLACSTIMGFDEPDVDQLLPGNRSAQIPHINWNRILEDVWGEEVDV